LIAGGVAVCANASGEEPYVVIKSDNAISCIKMSTKVIAAASGGRECKDIVYIDAMV
jgi:hypothetical protein